MLHSAVTNTIRAAPSTTKITESDLIFYASEVIKFGKFGNDINNCSVSVVSISVFL